MIETKTNEVQKNSGETQPLLPTVPCNVVYHEDCMVGLKRFPDNYFDLAVVDPPYGIGLVKTEAGNWGQRKENKGSIDKQTQWDFEAPNSEYFTQLRRVSKNQIVWGANHFISRMPFDSSCWIVWDKVNGESYFADCELAWTSFEKAVRMYRKRTVMKDRIHITQKPVELYEWILQKFANDGDLILDTHVGSGSSRIAAHKAGLSFIGFEIDKDYYEAQEKRFSDFKRQMRLF